MGEKLQTNTETYTTAGDKIAFSRSCYGAGSLIFYVKNNDESNAFTSMTLSGWVGDEWHEISLTSNNFTTYNALAADTSKVFIANVFKYTKVKLVCAVTAAGSVKTESWIAVPQPEALDSETIDDVLTELESINDNIGATDAVAVTGDTAGTMSAKLRGLLKTLGEIDDGSLVNGSVTAILRYIGTQLETRLLSLDTKEGSTGDASDVDGTRAGQLRYIGEQINSLIGATNTLLGTIDIDTGNISSKIDLIDTGIDNIETYTNAIKTAIEIIDDWDESDRAKVNLIAGQAGIDGDSGAKSAKTIRTVTSTDDPSIGSLGDAEDADGSIHAQLYYLANRLDAVEGSIDEIETTVDTANDLMKIEEQSPTLSAYSNTLIQDAITATAESAYYDLLSNGKGFTIIYGDVTVTSGDVDIIITEADSGENVEVPQDTLNFSASDTFIVRLEGTGKVKVGTTISADAVVTVAMDNRGGK